MSLTMSSSFAFAFLCDAVFVVLYVVVDVVFVVLYVVDDVFVVLVDVVVRTSPGQNGALALVAH